MKQNILEITEQGKKVLKEQSENDRAFKIAYKIAKKYKTFLMSDELEDLEGDIAFALISLAYKR